MLSYQFCYDGKIDFENCGQTKDYEMKRLTSLIYMKKIIRCLFMKKKTCDSIYYLVHTIWAYTLDVFRYSSSHHIHKLKQLVLLIIRNWIKDSIVYILGFLLGVWVWFRKSYLICSSKVLVKTFEEKKNRR